MFDNACCHYNYISQSLVPQRMTHCKQLDGVRFWFPSLHHSYWGAVEDINQIGFLSNDHSIHHTLLLSCTDHCLSYRQYPPEYFLHPLCLYLRQGSALCNIITKYTCLQINSAWFDHSFCLHSLCLGGFLSALNYVLSLLDDSAGIFRDKYNVGLFQRQMRLLQKYAELLWEPVETSYFDRR